MVSVLLPNKENKMKARRKLIPGILAVGFPSKRDEAVLNQSGVRCESVLYDFSQDGGAVGDIEFGRLIPAGAIIKRITSDEQIAFTSGGAATVVINAGSTSLTAALAFDTDFTGVDAQALVSAEGMKVSVDSELKITIAVAALTAGKVRFFVEYLLPND